jgi:phospholipid/cholesterol/gamma-HCH transport system substrate-binding protein
LALAGCGDDGKPKQTGARAEPTMLSFEAAASPRLPAALGPGDDVRISGLVVGSVTDVARGPSQAIVRMRIRIRPAWPVEAGVWPPRTNATIIVRPRIFKEGDYFMDLTPGTYKAPELKEGARLPASRTRLQPPSLLTG